MEGSQWTLEGGRVKWRKGVPAFPSHLCKVHAAVERSQWLDFLWQAGKDGGFAFKLTGVTKGTLMCRDEEASCLPAPS